MNEHDVDICKEALTWLRFAKDDLNAAMQLINAEYVLPKQICWHSQQAAEKAIRAALLLESVDFPPCTTWSF